jgi:hypothetical protein
MARIARIAARLVLPVMFAAAVAVPAMTHEAPEAGWNASPVEGIGYESMTQAKPANLPTWDREASAAFPKCEANREGVLYPVVVVVTMGGDLSRMSFDEAWGRGTNDERADDVWVVGGCAR